MHDNSAARNAASSGQTKSLIRVLAVDDNLQLLEFLALLLEDAGCLTTTSVSSVEAALLAQTQRFDIVISDIRMPHLSGPEMMADIRKTHTNMDVPVIFISGQLLVENHAHDASPLNHYLRKPFSSKELLGLLEIIVSNRQAKAHAIWLTGGLSNSSALST